LPHQLEAVDTPYAEQTGTEIFLKAVSNWVPRSSGFCSVKTWHFCILFLSSTEPVQKFLQFCRLLFCMLLLTCDIFTKHYVTFLFFKLYTLQMNTLCLTDCISQAQKTHLHCATNVKD
jgi:hypothetical protein